MLIVSPRHSRFTFRLLISGSKLLCAVAILILSLPLAARAQSAESYCNALYFGNQTTVPVSAWVACPDPMYPGDHVSNWNLVSSSSSSSAFIFDGPSSVSDSSSIYFEVTFDPTNIGYYTGTINATYQGIGYNNYTYTLYININSLNGTYLLPGFINPKYVVLSVQYAPPGDQVKAAQYKNDTVTGSSSTEKDSFANTVTHTVSVSGTLGIPGYTTTITATTSNAYTQESDTSSTVAVSQESSYETDIDGVETPAGVNHDYDFIRVWLNPVLSYAIGPNSTNVTWTGFGYDLNDTDAYPYMEVVPVKMGCLNGDIPASDANCTYFFGRAQRTWALNNVDGSGPGLTGDGAGCVPGSGSDICNILATDPFSNTGYTFTFSGNTTTDGRFTACHDSANCAQTISCVPGYVNGYSQGYSVTDSSSQTAKDTYEQTFSINAQVKAGFVNMFEANLLNSTKITISHEFTQATNNSSSQTATLSIGPSSSYTGPEGFDVYQDNLFGTFVFRPIPQ